MTCTPPHFFAVGIARHSFTHKIQKEKNTKTGVPSRCFFFVFLYFRTKIGFCGVDQSPMPMLSIRRLLNSFAVL